MENPSAPASPAQAPASAGCDVFLSYNPADRAVIALIRRGLGERGIRAFYDQDSLVPGLPRMEGLETALLGAHAVTVFLGPEGLGSWQKRERALALERQLAEEKTGRRFPVIPVLLSGADLMKASGFLLLGTWIDLRRPEDPRQLEALVRALRGEPAPAVEATLEALCPYRSLQAFQEEDADLFFGREVFIESLWKKLEGHGLVAVVGASGSGKSSVVQAGLLPLLRRMKPPEAVWEAVVLTPGRRPFHSLAAQLIPLWEKEMSRTDQLREMEKLGEALARGEVSLGEALKQTLRDSRSADRLLVVVDQFEELFTLAGEPEAHAFISRLLQAPKDAPVKLVFTLRADFYGRAIAANRELSDAIQQGVVNLSSMTRDELRRAIEVPAAKGGLRFEPGLLERILDQMEGQPGNLPLVEFALTTLWKERENGVLLNARFDAMGGVAGALGTVAEATFKALPGDQQAAVLRMLPRLVRVATAGEEGTDTRQRLLLRELDERGQQVARKFVDARLLVMDREPGTNEETVEVSHEALIRSWERLRRALDEQRDFLVWRQHLRFRIAEWQRAKEDSELLLRGPLLLEARQWLEQRRDELNPAELGFIHASALAKRMSRAAMAPAVALGVLALVFFAWTFTDHYRFRNSIQTVADEKLPSTVDETDAEASIQWVAALVRAGEEAEALDTIARLWPETRAEAVVAMVEQFVKLNRLERASAALSTSWPRDHFDWSSRRWNTLVSLAEALARASPGTDFTGILRYIESPENRTKALAALADGLQRAGQSDRSQQLLEGFLQQAEQIDPSRRGGVLEFIIENLSPAFKASPLREPLAIRLQSLLKENPESLARALVSLGDVQRVVSFMEPKVQKGKFFPLEAFYLCTLLIEAKSPETVMELAIRLAQVDDTRKTETWDTFSTLGNCLAEAGELPSVLTLLSRSLNEKELQVFAPARDLFPGTQDQGERRSSPTATARTLPFSRILHRPSKKLTTLLTEPSIIKKLDSMTNGMEFVSLAAALLVEELARSDRFEDAHLLGQVFCETEATNTQKILLVAGLARLQAGQPVNTRELVDQMLSCDGYSSYDMMEVRPWTQLTAELIFELLSVRDADGAERLINMYSAAQTENRTPLLKFVMPRLVQAHMMETALQLVEKELDKSPLMAEIVIALAREKDFEQATALLLAKISSEQEKSRAAMVLATAQAESGALRAAHATADSCFFADRLRAYTAIVNQYATKQGAPQ
ncbi:nSTAND1 domain-containing NTPase [Archangium lansingense]|uniref:TIR domain-containing protein n=1 Tax=Archangium lansingense TaxID=2995310 RepID=A0ABT4APM2_9BACT|nr:TIR domain-containing protein [Archangium lansinium]MCY1083645.1 TIR domain-containing protein [Archangium lansinium]